MFRTLTILVATGFFGTCLGYLQSALTTSGIDERMPISRESLAESRGEATRDQIIQMSSGEPRIEVVGGTVYDFGMMKYGDKQSHTFTVKNVGSGPLTLDLGNSTCKCTVGELDASIVMPGEQTEVTLTWEAKTPLRDFGQSAAIITNDVDNREIKLEIRGMIAGAYVIEPESMSLGDILDQDGTERTFHVFSYREDSKNIKDFTWTDKRTKDFVEIESSPIEVDLEQFPHHSSATAAHEVRIKLKPGLPVGRMSSQIQFATDLGEELGNMELSVYGVVSGVFELRGGPSFDRELSLLKIGTVDSEKGAIVSVFLIAQGEDKDDIKIEVTSVEPAEALQVEVDEAAVRGRKRMYPIRFKVPKGAPEVNFPGSGEGTFGKVVLKIIGEQTQEIPVYIRLIVNKSGR